MRQSLGGRRRQRDRRREVDAGQQIWKRGAGRSRSIGPAVPSAAPASQRQRPVVQGPSGGRDSSHGRSAARSRSSRSRSSLIGGEIELSWIVEQFAPVLQFLVAPDPSAVLRWALPSSANTTHRGAAIGAVGDRFQDQGVLPAVPEIVGVEKLVARLHETVRRVAPRIPGRRRRLPRHRTGSGSALPSGRACCRRAGRNAGACPASRNSTAGRRAADRGSGRRQGRPGARSAA